MTYATDDGGSRSRLSGYRSVLRVMNEDRCAAMVDDPGHFGGRDPRVERDQHGTGEGHRVVRRQQHVRVASDDRDAIARAYSERPQ